MRAGVLLFVLAVALTMASFVHAWGSDNDRVLLEKVSVLTLEQGKMTTGRRSAPVQQLQCVGGSGGCSYGNQPRVVQCYNRGFDGYDVQWECKAEVDSKYQFGRLKVSCEGYEYPDDPYILRGSCGLEYELDITQHGDNSYRHHDNYHGHSASHPYHHSNKSWSWGGILGLAVAGFILYQCLKGCFSGQQRQRMTTDSSTSSGSTSYSAPPPTSGTGAAGGGGWGSFFTGAATGGTLGYLFGNRGYGGYGAGYGGYGGYGRGSSWGGGYSRGYRSSGWGSGGFGGFGGGGGSRSSSSRSRTTSGFGGTSRR